MASTSLFRSIAPALAFFVLAVTAHAQVQAFTTYHGKRLPIMQYDDTDEYLYVVDDGRLERADDFNVEVRAAKTFADGFVTISGTEAALDLLNQASPKKRTDPSAIRARFRATITADRGLSDCYGLLTFVTQGSVGTRLVPIGHLWAGHAKKIEVKMRNDVNSIGSLHIFSGGTEVRTNQHPNSYDVVQYYAGLVKNVKGLSAAELLKFEEQYPHELTADGRYLATVRKRGEKKMIFVYDLESMKRVCEVAVAGVEDQVSDLTWVSDDKLVYIAPERDVGYELKLHLLDTAKGITHIVLDHISEIVNSTPDHPEILELGSDKFGVFMKYNALTGKKYDFEDPDASGYWFDAHGTSRIKIWFDEAKRNYEFRPTPNSRWRDIDDLVKEPGLKFNRKSSDDLERVADILSVGPDGDTLYISTRLRSDKFELAAFSMSEGVIKRIIAQHPKFDLTTEEGSGARLLFAKGSTRLLGMVYVGIKTHVIWTDPRYAAVQKRIDATFPDHVNVPIDWSRDGKTLIYLSYSDQDPGTYYLFRPAKGELTPLLESSEYLKGKSLGRTTPIEIIARDGAKIPGYVTMPPETDGKLPPLIVNIHGGPMARDNWGFDPENQFFATRGYVVLQVNYRGSSGYGAAFQAAGLHARLDTVVIDDIADGVRQLINNRQVDPNRIVAMGGSFGGWATYICLARYPDLFHVGVAIAAVSSWKQALSDDHRFLHNESGYAFWKALLTRQDYPATAKFLDPVLRAGEIKQPVFIVHGERDPVVRVTEARSMLDALKKQGTVVEAKSFADAGHSEWSFDNRVEMLNEIAAFIDRNLPRAAPDPKSAVAVNAAR